MSKLHSFCLVWLSWLGEIEYQRPWSINVWWRIVEDQFIGPYWIDSILNVEKYRDRQEGPVNWPAKSPDLMSSDFYLWGYLMSNFNKCQKLVLT